MGSIDAASAIDDGLHPAAHGGLPMRVLVASTYVPFIEGGGRMIVRDLVRAVREHGHEVDTVEIPFVSVWDRMLEQMLALRLMDVEDAADILVAIRTPSYLLRHPNKRLWFIHHHRGAYDLWGTPYQDLPSTPEGLGVRDAIIAADELYLRESQRIFTNSQIVADRLREFNGLQGEVLYPPLGEPQRFVSGAAEDYVFYPCRITGHKRQHLLVRAAAHLTTDVRVVIAGAADSPEQLDPLRETIAHHRLEDRVQLIPRWISEEEKADLIARSIGVLYVPFLEDSYGYVTLEAFHARKPVITCSDSGGTLEIIEDGVNGLIASPEPASLAAAIDRLRADPRDALEMGERAHATLRAKGISWERVIDRLLG
jgi:glycosyltransferase involved in cell wall biosynthesis